MVSNQPILSIISVNLNNSTGLQKTIKSVLSQNFTDFEYIIIDGGSTDGSNDIIKHYANKIAYWVSEPDKGIYNAMNNGISMAKGEYLLFLNSGDWLVDENILSKVFKISRTADIVYGNIYEVMPNGSKKLQVSLSEEKLSLANFNSNKHSTVQQPAAFIKRTLFEKGMFDESYKIIADIKFFIDRIVIQNCTVDHLNYVITNFDMKGISSNPSNWGQTIEERNRIFRELLPPRILKDYELFFQIKDSPLLNHIPFLEKTSGLNRLIVRFVIWSIKIYKAFRS